MESIQSLLPRIKGMLVERLFLNVVPEDMPDGANIMDEYGIDSVALLELVVALEDEFGIEFTPSPEITTVGKLVEAVEKLTNED